MATSSSRGGRRVGPALQPLVIFVGIALATACGPAPAPAPTPPSVPVASRVVDAVTEDGIRADLAMLAAAGATSPSFRALGSPGYDAAVDAVEGVLRDAGWTVHEDAFTAPAFADEGASTLSVGGATYSSDDVRPLIYAPAGTAEGPVVAMGWPPGAAAPSGRGCDVTDYGTLPEHAIVVAGRDDCYRRQAVVAAQAAGAAAYIAVAEGPPGTPPLRPTLISPSGLAIPAVAVSARVASALRAAADTHATAKLVATARTWNAPTRSVVAELAGSVAGRVVMVGAHLDSVIDGPGIDDDGTGVAALLQLARALAGTRPQTTIRLAFWTAEEEGLVGSAHYVAGLGGADLNAIVAYLNADMIGSPNGYAGVYEESGSPTGSPAVGALLRAALGRLGVTAVPVDTGGGSDHVPFSRAGVPVGGLFSGASEPVTDAQATSFGATAGRSADACYHQACDGVENVGLRLARVLAAALADTAVRISDNPVLVNR